MYVKLKDSKKFLNKFGSLDKKRELKREYLREEFPNYCPQPCRLLPANENNMFLWGLREVPSGCLVSFETQKYLQ